MIGDVNAVYKALDMTGNYVVCILELPVVSLLLDLVSQPIDMSGSKFKRAWLWHGSSKKKYALVLLLLPPMGRQRVLFEGHQSIDYLMGLW